MVLLLVITQQIDLKTTVHIVMLLKLKVMALLSAAQTPHTIHRLVDEVGEGIDRPQDLTAHIADD